MTEFEVVVRVFLRIQAPGPAEACEAAKITVAGLDGTQLAIQAEYVALPYAGPGSAPQSDTEYHP